jgi:hypothetical protein
MEYQYGELGFGGTQAMAQYNALGIPFSPICCALSAMNAGNGDVHICIWCIHNSALDMDW